MSDRIDELVATIRDDFIERTNSVRPVFALTELATIARDAVADRDKWVDRCYQSDERALEAEAMRWQWERAAMEADVIVDDLLNNQRQGDYEPYYETSLGDNLIVFKRIIAAARRGGEAR